MEAATLPSVAGSVQLRDKTHLECHRSSTLTYARVRAHTHTHTCTHTRTHTHAHTHTRTHAGAAGPEGADGERANIPWRHGCHEPRASGAAVRGWPLLAWRQGAWRFLMWQDLLCLCGRTAMPLVRPVPQAVLPSSSAPAWILLNLCLPCSHVDPSARTSEGGVTHPGQKEIHLGSAQCQLNL